MLTTGYPRFRGDLFGLFIHELARELAGRGLSVSVVAPHEAGLPVGEVADDVSVFRFQYVFPATWQKLAYGSGIPANLRRSLRARLQVPVFLAAFLWRAWRVCRQCQVLHCHWTVTGVVGWLCRWRRGSPVVLSVRGSDLNLLDRGVTRSLNRAVFRLVDAVVVVSREMRQRLIDAGVSEGKVTVIPNGVSERFEPTDQARARADVGVPIEGVLVGFVGLLAPVKGLEVLVEAFAALSCKDLSLVLVGEGSMRGALESQVADHGLTERVRLVGQRPASEIPVWLNAFDFLVLPSYSEGRPNVILEALSCGRAVVATRVGGTPELVEDGVTGLLVQPGDAPGLARAIETLAADAVRRERMGLAGRRWIREQGLTWPACGEAHLRLYRKVLSEASACAE